MYPISRTAKTVLRAFGSFGSDPARVVGDFLNALKGPQMKHPKQTRGPSATVTSVTVSDITATLDVAVSVTCQGCQPDREDRTHAVMGFNPSDLLSEKNQMALLFLLSSDSSDHPPERVAAAVGRSAGTLSNLRNIGGGPKFRKVGGKIMYRKSDVIAWIEQNPAVSSLTALDESKRG